MKPRWHLKEYKKVASTEKKIYKNKFVTYEGRCTYTRLGDMPTECILTKNLDVNKLCLVTNFMRWPGDMWKWTRDMHKGKSVNSC